MGPKAKPVPLDNRQILQTFRNRCEKAAEWRASCIYMVNLLEELCHHSNTTETFLHYFKELYIITSFVFEECTLLIYGIITRTVQSNRNANMIMSGKTGSFEAVFKGKETHRKCALTLCSAEGLKYLRKIGDISKTEETEVEGLCHELHDTVLKVRDVCDSFTLKILKDRGGKRREINYSEYHGKFNLQFVLSQTKSAELYVYQLVDVLTEVHSAAGRNLFEEIEQRVVYHSNDTSFNHAKVVGDYLAAVKAVAEKTRLAAEASRLKALETQRKAEERKRLAAANKAANTSNQQEAVGQTGGFGALLAASKSRPAVSNEEAEEGNSSKEEGGSGGDSNDLDAIFGPDSDNDDGRKHSSLFVPGSNLSLFDEEAHEAADEEEYESKKDMKQLKSLVGDGRLKSLVGDGRLADGSSAKKKAKRGTTFMNRPADMGFIVDDDYHSEDDEDSDDGGGSSVGVSAKKHKTTSGRTPRTKSTTTTPSASSKPPGLKKDGSERKKRNGCGLTEDAINGYDLDVTVSYGIGSGSDDDGEPPSASLMDETMELDGTISSGQQVVVVAEGSLDEDLNAKLDKRLKCFLLNQMEYDLIRDITFERTLCQYCAEKRAVMKVPAGVKMDLNWKSTVSMLGQRLRDKYATAKDKLILYLNNEKIKNPTSTAAVDGKLKAIMLVEKSFKRKINNLEHSLLNKIINLWLALNENLAVIGNVDEKVLAKRLAKETKSDIMKVMLGSDDDEDESGLGSLFHTLRTTQTDPAEMLDLITVMETKHPDNALPLTQASMDKYLMPKVAGDPKLSPASCVADGGQLPQTTSPSAAAAHGATLEEVETTMSRDGLHHLRAFLKVFLEGVGGETSVLCVKLQAKLSAKDPGIIDFLLFLVEHSAETDCAKLYELLKGSAFFAKLHCNFYNPFDEKDYGNTLADGYCFYRAIFQLYLREKSEYQLSLREMRDIDRILRIAHSDTRVDFFNFLNTVRKGIAGGEGDKTKVNNAKFAFFNLHGSLAKAFWGCMDWIASLHFNCSGFAASESAGMGGWKRFWCSSLLLRKVAEVGSLPSMGEIHTILSKGVNFMVHHQDHFFPVLPASQTEIMESFQTIVGGMVGTMVDRLNVIDRVDPAADTALSLVSFADIVKGIKANAAMDYKGYFETAAMRFHEHYTVTVCKGDEIREVPQDPPVPTFLIPQELEIFKLKLENTRLKQENEAIKQMIKEQKKAADAAAASSAAIRSAVSAHPPPPSPSVCSTPLPPVPYKSSFVLATPCDEEEGRDLDQPSSESN